MIIYKTRKDTFVTIISESVNRRGEVRVHCSSCSEDVELFPDPFFTTVNKLGLGKFPCGCNSKVCWTKEQYQIKLDRKAKESNFSAVRFTGNYKGKRSTVVYDCYDCGAKDNKSTVDRVLRSSLSCISCAKILLGNRKRTELSEWKSLGISTEVLTNNSKFFRISNATNFIYSCAVCSVDDYVRNGLCSGLFLTNISSLRKGYKSCRCARCYRKTRAQWDFEIRKTCKESSYPLSHIVRPEGTSLSAMQVFRVCAEHGRFSTNAKSLLFKETGCPECPINSGQKQCYINIIYDEGNPIAIKYGISTDYIARLKKVSRSSRFVLKNLGVWEMPTFYDCTSCEKEVKRVYSGVVSKEDMPDGYTETASVMYTDDIIKIYESYGGVRSIK